MRMFCCVSFSDHNLAGVSGMRSEWMLANGRNTSFNKHNGFASWPYDCGTPSTIVSAVAACVEILLRKVYFWIVDVRCCELRL